MLSTSLRPTTTLRPWQLGLSPQPRTFMRVGSFAPSPAAKATGVTTLTIVIDCD